MSKPAVQIDKLSSAERLQLIDELWESLSDSPDSVPVTDEQRTELDRRSMTWSATEPRVSRGTRS